jgi:methylenetetrahydrofolate dehydrogenase (NADP+)/methenyltetrahydrofolate cyclohydrolase
VDVGINVVGGTIVGDVDFESVRPKASAITPVPGGVGPLTNALLLAHLVRAANRQETHAAGDGDPPPAVPSRASRASAPSASATVPGQPVATTARGVR